MNCTSYTLAGLNAGCKNSVGGIKKIWLYDTDTYGDVSWEIDNQTNTVNIHDGSQGFVPYILRNNSASMTSTLNVNENAGNFYTTEITINFLKMETAKRIELMAMFMGSVSAVVQDNNDHFWGVGIEAHLEASAGTGETGTAKTDANQYTITLSVDESELPREITDEYTIDDFMRL